MKAGFLQEIRSVLGENCVAINEQLEPFMEDVGGFHRSIPAVVFPNSVSDVQNVIKISRKHGQPIYPFSKGKNWGLGSRLPVSDDCVLVDLGQMNAIRELETTDGWVVIEPGVSQSKLADALTDTSWFCDVTGSGADSSLIGNALERGVAYNTLRCEQLLWIEIVLGNGEIVRTGFANDPRSLVAGLFRYGIGPDIQGLFFQSNFGIITAACLSLQPRQECHESFLLNLSNPSRLGELVETLRDLKRQGVLGSVVHIGNRRRSHISASPLVYEKLKSQNKNPSRKQVEEIVSSNVREDWNAVGCIVGRQEVVRSQKKILKKETRRFGRVRFLSPKTLKWATLLTKWFHLRKTHIFLEAVSPLFGLNRGEPTDAPLRSIYWPMCEACPQFIDVDAGSSGVLFSVPVVPMNAKAVKLALSILEESKKRFGFEFAVTLNMMNERALEGVISIDFQRRDSKQLRLAHECIAWLDEQWLSNGLTPLRIDIDNMRLLASHENPYWRTIDQLKSVLDPDAIVSPGRYCLR